MANELNDVFEGANIDAIKHTKDKTSILDHKFKEINEDIKNGDYEEAKKKVKTIRGEAREYLRQLDALQDNSTFDSSVISMLVDIVPMAIPGVNLVHAYNVLKGYNGRLKNINSQNRPRLVEMKDLNAIIDRCRTRMERYVAKADKIYDKVQAYLAENDENVKKEYAEELNDIFEGANIDAINFTKKTTSDLDDRIADVKVEIAKGNYFAASDKAFDIEDDCVKAKEELNKIQDKSSFDSSVISMLVDIVPMAIPGVNLVHTYNVLKGYDERLKNINRTKVRQVEMKDLNVIINRCLKKLNSYEVKAHKLRVKISKLMNDPDSYRKAKEKTIAKEKKKEKKASVKKESAYISDADEQMINEYTCDFDSDLDSMIKEIKGAIDDKSFSDAKKLIKKAKNQCTKAFDSIEKAGKKDRQKVLKCFKVLSKLERKVDGCMTKESMEIFDTTNFAYVGEAYDLSDDSDDVDDEVEDIINNDDTSSYDDEDEANSSEKMDEVLDDVDDTSDSDEESVSTTCGAMLPQGMGYGLSEGNDDIMGTLGTDESDFSATDGYKIDNVDDFLGDGDDEFKVNKEILHLENNENNSNASNNSNNNSSDSDDDNDDYVDVDATEAVNYIDPYDVVTEAFDNLKNDIKGGIDKANDIIRGRGRIDTVREDLVREVLDVYQKIKENQIRLKVMKIKFPKARKSSDYRKIQEDNITLEKKYRAIIKTANRNEKTYIKKTRQAIDASTKAEFNKQIENAKKFRKANRKPLFSRESVDYDVDGLSPLDFGFSVDEAANIDPDIKDDIKKLNDLGYATKYSSSGHHKLRKKEDINHDGVYYGKLYTDARLMFSGNYNFPSAPKYWEFKSVEGHDYLDVPPITYNPKDGTPDEAFSKWKKAYMQSLETWIDSLRTRSGSDKNIVDKDGNTMGESVDEFFEETLTDILIDTL
jgi:hypothetical protein